MIIQENMPHAIQHVDVPVNKLFQQQRNQTNKTFRIDHKVIC